MGWGWGCHAGCSQEDACLGKKEFPPRSCISLHLTRPRLGCCKALPAPQPKSHEAAEAGLPFLDCGNASQEAVERGKESGEEFEQLWDAAQGRLLGDRWEALAWGFGAVSGGSLLGRAIAQPGQDLKERSYGSRKFLSHKTMSEHPQGWRLREEPSGQQPHSGRL